MDQSQLLSLNVANQALYNRIKYQVVTGPPGPAGYTGPAGSSTNTGATGTPGTSGSATNTGATGTAGTTGPAGLAGSATNTGATGTPGSATNTGSTGNQGNPGATGSTGIQGSATNTGATGQAGTIGVTGATGLNGVATNTGATGAPGPQGATGPAATSGGGSFGVIKVPSSSANFNFSTGVSTLPSDFGTYNPGSATDSVTFTITLNSKYNPSNLPFYTLTAYVFSNTAGYINCQRQLGAQSGVAAASITMNAAVTTITFNYMNKTNFPYTVNDSSGFALYICFNILN